MNEEIKTGLAGEIEIDIYHRGDTRSRSTMNQICINTHGAVPGGSAITVTCKTNRSAAFESVEDGVIDATLPAKTVSLPEWIIDAIKVTPDAAFIGAGCTFDVIYTGYNHHKQ